MANRRRTRKPPRVVLLDTRQLADLTEITARMREALDSIQQLTTLVVALSEGARVLLPMVSEMHQAQQKRSSAARKANATRQSTLAGSAGAAAVENITQEVQADGA
jgi:hypothetical protein